MSCLIGVVDDDPSILRALRRLLAAAGFDVKTFASGEELLASDALGTIDCLVLDIHLGGCSGFEIQEHGPRRYGCSRTGPSNHQV
jgi:FixJ family two-component response regulator